MKKIIWVIVFIGIISFLVIPLGRNKKDENQVLDEILDGQIVLYFLNKDANELEKEYRFVKMSDIKNDMIGTILRELKNGPKTEGLKSTIPDGTKVNEIKIEGNTVIINLSEEFISASLDSGLENIFSVYSIVNSLTEITEIDNVKFLIDGKEKEMYKDNFKFNESFMREI